MIAWYKFDDKKILEQIVQGMVLMPLLPGIMPPS